VKPVFADTVYYLALVNPRDPYAAMAALPFVPGGLQKHADQVD
jgi:hypothetical protein